MHRSDHNGISLDCHRRGRQLSLVYLLSVWSLDAHALTTSYCSLTHSTTHLLPLSHCQLL